MIKGGLGGGKRRGGGLNSNGHKTLRRIPKTGKKKKWGEKKSKPDSSEQSTDRGGRGGAVLR